MGANGISEKSTETRPLCGEQVEPVDPRVARSRAKLLAAATEILVESGPAALTVDAVAERSGVAKSTLYRHWPSRTALMIDVLRTNIPSTPQLDPTQGFERCLRDFVTGIAAHFTDPEWRRILPALMTLKQYLPEVDDLTDNDRDAKIESLHTVLEQGIREGRLPADVDAHDVAMTLVGPLMMCSLLGHDPEAVLGVGEYTIERFLASYRDTRATEPAAD